MHTGKRQWRELVVPVVMFAMLMPLLVGLSVWQYHRGEEKAARWQEFENGASRVVELQDENLLDELATLPEYQRVSATGRYLDDYQVLLDNRPEQGRPGWHVLTPFRLRDSDVLLLVDRGWLPANAGELPDVTVSEQPREITGRLASLPRPGLELEGSVPPSGWPKPMQFPDVGDIADALAKAGITSPVAGRILWLDASAADGYGRNWQPAGLSPERHYAYSFQWLALALTLGIIFIVLLRRWWRRSPRAN